MGLLSCLLLLGVIFVLAPVVIIVIVIINHIREYGNTPGKNEDDAWLKGR